MKKKLLKFVFAVLFLFLPAISYGQLITIAITANVTGVSDADNLLQGNVSVGSTITGTYTYNTSTIDMDSRANVGAYFHYGSPYGLSLTVNNLNFKSTPNNIKFLIALTNDGFNPNGDFYIARSYNNIIVNSNVLVDSIAWQIDDISSTALLSPTLPTNAPVLSDWDYSTLYIGGGTGGTPPCYDKTFYVEAIVISAVLVPEPMSVLLFGFGLLVLRKTKKITRL